MKYEIDCEQFGSRKTECYIECFERMLTIIFKGISEDEVVLLESFMQITYYRWHDGETDMCCEEFIIDELPPCYKDKIVAVIYEEEEEND